MQDRNTVVLPRNPGRHSIAEMAVLHILKTLAFNSQTLKSGVVVQSDDADPDSALLFMRGAPGVIKNLVEDASLPTDFDRVQV